MGGKRLKARGAELPSYMDTHYNCEMELLGFDSTLPDAHYGKWIDECRTALLELPVVSQTLPTHATGLMHLHRAISHPTSQPVFAPVHAN